MVYTVESIIWYLVALDAIGAVIFAFFCDGCNKWYKKNYAWFWKHLPLTKGWALAYFGLVLWVGYGLLRLGIA